MYIFQQRFNISISSAFPSFGTRLIQLWLCVRYTHIHYVSLVFSSIFDCFALHVCSHAKYLFISDREKKSAFACPINRSIHISENVSFRMHKYPLFDSIHRPQSLCTCFMRQIRSISKAHWKAIRSELIKRISEKSKWHTVERGWWFDWISCLCRVARFSDMMKPHRNSPSRNCSRLQL